MIDLEQEHWKVIEDFPRYMISNYGNVKSCIGKEKLLKPYKVCGYLVVKLSKEPDKQGEYLQKSLKIHRLTAKYFCPGYSEDKQVHHIDRQKANNYYKNLLCVTKAEHAAIHKKLNNEIEVEATANKAVAFDLQEKEIKNNASTESENNLYSTQIR